MGEFLGRNVAVIVELVIKVGNRGFFRLMPLKLKDLEKWRQFHSRGRLWYNRDRGFTGWGGGVILGRDVKV